MRVLVVTNIYPTATSPTLGTFVGRQVESLIALGLTVDVCFVDRQTQGWRAYIRLPQRLNKLLSNTTYDIVHVMYGGVLAFVTSQIMKRFKIPYVVSFCGSDLLGEPLNGILRRFTNAVSGVFLSQITARRAHGIVVKSNNLRQALWFSEDRKRSIILPNGVDLNIFKPLDSEEARQKLHWSSDAFHVVFPANGGHPLKRFALAQAAVNLANQLQPQKPFMLHELKQVPHHDVVYWLSGAHALILTSIHEGSPNIVKESMACNLPVVSLNVGDVRERLEGVEHSYVVDKASPALLAEQLLRLQPGHRSNGRIMITPLALESIALQLKSFYQQIIVSFSQST